MNVRKIQLLNAGCLFCLLLFSSISCRENNSTPNRVILSDICASDLHVSGIKMLVYSLLIDHMDKDTVFIVDKKLLSPNKFQSIYSNIDSFWKRLPIQIDTTSKNVYEVKGHHTIDCLSKIHFDQMVVKTLNEIDLPSKFSRKHNNVCLQISDYYVFEKEGLYGLAIRQMSDKLNVSNFYILSEGNNFLRYTSNDF